MLDVSVCTLDVGVDVTRHRRIIYVRSGLKERTVTKLSYYYRKCQIPKDIGGVCVATMADNTLSITGPI